jgi:hypothetical protein
MAINPTPKAPLVDLDDLKRPSLTTEEAAVLLNRKPQTLRQWACKQNGPIQPRRIGNRLHWSPADIRKLVVW